MDWKEFILDIINKILYVMYLLSIVGISASLFLYIFTDNIRFGGLAWFSLILAIMFGKLESITMDKLLKYN